MQLFYSSVPLSSQEPALLTLDPEESFHLARVVRLRNGDTVNLTDGLGKAGSGVLLDANPKGCLVEVTEVHDGSDMLNRYLHIAVAPTKNMDRLEWFLEKATEIGISEVTPVICEHSERTALRTDRLKKVALAAMKQSLHTFLPKVNEPVKLRDFLRKDFAGQKFIAYVEERQEVQLKAAYKPGGDCIILIGPEGDFSPDEVSNAAASGFQKVSLGPSRLRTETAALVACHTINLINA